MNRELIRQWDLRPTLPSAANIKGPQSLSVVVVVNNGLFAKSHLALILSCMAEPERCIRRFIEYQREAA
jgi:hypothetical protein